MSKEEKLDGARELLRNSTAKKRKLRSIDGTGWLSRIRRASPHRLNKKAISILLGITVVAGLLYFPISYFQQRWLQRAAIAQARADFEADRVDQAILGIDAYLATWPDDLDGLQLKGEVLAKAGYTGDKVFQAIQAIDTLLRLDPDPPERQEDRKRLIELSIRLGDMVRAGSERQKSGSDKLENRYRFANKIAEQRITKYKADDAEAHRLLAMTLDRLSYTGDTVSGTEAISEYQKALRRDPGDYRSAERLAALRMERRKDQAGADQILENLVKARPRLVDAWLARARHFLKTGRDDRAKLDLEAASKLDPTNKGVRLTAANLALRRGDAASARRHLDAILESGRDDARLDILLAQLEFLERRPEKALEKIRAGLLRTAGTDRELTWRLAYWLIQLGRTAEARPLMTQFGRLVGRADHPMVRLLEGELREKVGRHASAILELEAALDEIDGEWKTEVEMALGRCHEALGDLEAAKTNYVKARDLFPSSPTPRQSLSRLILKTDPARAISELEQAIRVSPATPSLLSDLAMAEIFRQQTKPANQRNWTAAEAAIQRGLRLKPDDPALARARMNLLVSTGKFDEASKWLEDATKGSGRTIEDNWLNRAQFLERRGQIDEALRILEEGSTPSAAGDNPRLRIARSLLLARTGHGRSSLLQLAVDVEKFPPNDRITLARAKADLLQSLGDREGAKLACLEWAGFAPDDPGPGIKLIEMARRGGTSEELEEGVAALVKAVGEDEPIALSAQSIAILVPYGQDQSATPRLDEAELLSQKLRTLAPNLPVTSLVRGLLCEQSSEFEEAIVAYKSAIKGDQTGLALPRLVALLNRLKRTEELALLKEQTSAAATAIDRITLQQNLAMGDKEQAEALLVRLVETQPDSLEYRADLARLLRELGKPEQSEKTLKDLVDLRPDRPQAWLALLASQLERGDKAAAVATVERLKKDYKGARPGLIVVRCLWAIGDREAAGKVCDQELARESNDLETLRVASEIDESNGRIDRAERLLVTARVIDPNVAWARRRLALILSSRTNYSRWNEAKALMEPTSTSVDSPDDRVVRALVLERGPDEESRAEAIRVYQSLADDLPANSPIGRKARISLTQLLLAKKKAAEAIKAIQPTTTEAASPDPATLALGIEAMAEGGNPEEARRLLERLIKDQPDAPSTIVAQALVLKAEGDINGAASTILDAANLSEKLPEGDRLFRFYFDRLVRLEADSAAEQLGRKILARWPAQSTPLGRFLAAHERYEESIQVAQTAIEANPSMEPLQLLAGLDASGKLSESLTTKVREIAIDASLKKSKDGGLLAMVTALLRRNQRFDDEAALYRKILQVDASNIVARNNLAWVLGHDLGKPDQALVEVDQVIKTAGPLPAAVHTRGMILGKLGRTADAVAELERATKVDPSAIHHIHLARAYGQAGRPDLRRKSLELARLALANRNSLEAEDLAELDSETR